MLQGEEEREIDGIFCDESCIEQQDEDDDVGTCMDRSILQESWQIDIIDESDN